MKNEKTINDLSIVRDTVWEKRKKLSKNSMGSKIWASVISGERVTIDDLCKRHKVREGNIRAALSRLWKRGYLLSPLVDSNGIAHVNPSATTGKLILVDILQKKEYLITFLRRHRKNSLLPSMKKAIMTYEAAGEFFPEMKGDLLLAINDDKTVFKEIYSTKLLK